MKNSIFILIILIVGCKENNDPFKNLKFGSISTKTVIRNMINNQIISNPKRDVDGNDSISFTYYFEDELGKIPVKFEANPNHYDFGGLREIKLTITDNFESLLNAKVDSTETSNLNRIKRLYEKWYNEPDSLKFLLNVPGNGGILKWQEPNFNIYINNIKSQPNVETYITYRMLDYDKEIERLKDSIIKNQTIKQLVLDGKVNFNWKKISNTYQRFEFTVYNISRKDKYDKRSIKSLRFDLSLQDEFGKELYKEDDFTIELNIELTPQSLPYYYPTNEQMYYLDYAIDDRNFKKLEETRKYSQNFKVTGIAIIKAVVMDDGSIINRIN